LHLRGLPIDHAKGLGDRPRRPRTRLRHRWEQARYNPEPDCGAAALKEAEPAWWLHLNGTRPEARRRSCTTWDASECACEDREAVGFTRRSEGAAILEPALRREVGDTREMPVAEAEQVSLDRSLVPSATDRALPLHA
jgi:hypothetical protein